ncbi:MAG: DUF3536 domain-containing protein [Acidimicrobiia bacterium]|jgi:alpha-amylase/alpha-mannosidase (GH57 family)
MTQPRHVVFHLHCYQPPREDPWTGAMPVEPSAFPAHDWNQRVTDECYRPLRAARLHDDRGFVVDAHNLYRDISVDMGATLHRWVAAHAHDVDEAIRAADADAAHLHAGHGSAIAQPYVHAILPLATARDKDTLVRWGIADFRHRFGREPEGIWLPEAAVDVDTLECLAVHGLRYTILGQHQAARVRDADGAWVAATGALDPARPYLARLPSGRAITVCFYDGALSHAIAFDRTLLDDGARLADAVAARAETVAGPALVVVATDGETFGHHHRFGEMALARALHDLSERDGITVGGLGAFLDAHPAVDEVEIASPSAWSCAHGVERWRADCGDVTGGEPHWNQRWRAPLRDAIDLLASRAGDCYETAAGEIVDDPWAARDAYGDVVDGSLAEREAFARTQTRDADPDTATVARLLGLLELQRHVLFSFSSCAWFFADCAGIETLISLHHAARVVELVRALTGVDLDGEVETALAPMQSNDRDAGDGPSLWRAARAAAVTPAHVAAWWGAQALVGVATPQVGRLRVAAHDVVSEGPADAPTAVTAAVVVVDEATGTPTRHAVVARADGAHLTVSVGERRFALADLPADPRTTVVAAWWHRLLDAPEPPSVAAVRALVEAGEAAAVTPDRELVEAALLRVAPAAVHRAADAPVDGLADLAFVVDALAGALPSRLRWTAQNALLAARDHTLPGMQARDDEAAACWRGAYSRAAELLAVAADPA